MEQKLDKIDHVIAHTKAGVDEMNLQKRREKIDVWLSAADHSINQKRAREGRQEGSGQWFIKGASFSTWQTEPASFLWLNGIPGCGKTVLSSTIIDCLQQDAADPGSSHILLYFYFDFTDTRKQSLENIIRSLISQLYYERPQTQKHVDSHWSLCKDGKTQPSTQDLAIIFEKMMEDTGDIWIVLDAIDECNTRDRNPGPGLLTWLRDLHFRQKGLHLLVTSRPEDDIRSLISSFAKEECIIRLQEALIAEDIHKFIHEQVANGEEFQRWHGHPEVQEEIERTLREKSNGM